MRGIDLDISTFSKASKTRDPACFQELLLKLKQELGVHIDLDLLAIFPLDSTIITLTSKLMWEQGFHQVKLFSGINLLNSEVGGITIHFGQGHDSKYGNETIDAIPKNGVGVMDRGFCSLARIEQLLARPDRYFVLRLKNNMHLEMLEDGYFLVGKDKGQVKVKVTAFCDLESRSEFRLASKLPAVERRELSNLEISEIYRLRWQIELLWKFLKMHLKLDRLITKNVNGITIQIYASLIAYMILRLVKIPKEYGHKALDKLRYLQAFMSDNISYVYWFEKLVFAR
jgi:IS4 transposase